MDTYCCNAFKALVLEGPNPGAEQDDKDKTLWHITGCCNAGCYIVNDMRYCPFCGQRFKE